MKYVIYKTQREIRKRFRSLKHFQYAKKWSALVVGAGGIGSNLIYVLAKYGIGRIFVVDFDEVEIHNIGGQMFNLSHIGMPKTAAAASVAAKIGYTEVYTYTVPIEALFMDEQNIVDIKKRPEIRMNNEFHKKLKTDNLIVIAGTDNFESRLNTFMIAKEIKEKKEINVFYIDARLMAETYDIYAFNMKNEDKINAYIANAFMKEDEREVRACTATQTAYAALDLSGKIMQLIAGEIANTGLGFNMYEVPFYVKWRGDSFVFEAKDLDLYKQDADIKTFIDGYNYRSICENKMEVKYDELIEYIRSITKNKQNEPQEKRSEDRTKNPQYAPRVLFPEYVNNT